jgi:hypothetical protein
MESEQSEFSNAELRLLADKVIKGIRCFKVDILPKNSVIEKLKSYTLGPRDKLKCSLCCFDSIDLSGFKENHCTKTCQDTLFCNKDVLKEVALHIKSFDPLLISGLTFE